jgi:hypothetical protein
MVSLKLGGYRAGAKLTPKARQAGCAARAARADAKASGLCHRHRRATGRGRNVAGRYCGGTQRTRHSYVQVGRVLPRLA